MNKQVKITTTAAIIIVIVFCALMISGFLLIGCRPPESTLRWKYVKSPLSGRCYEVASSAFGTQSGVMAMAEIGCEKTGL